MASSSTSSRDRAFADRIKAMGTNNGAAELIRVLENATSSVADKIQALLAIEYLIAKSSDWRELFPRIDDYLSDPKIQAERKGSKFLTADLCDKITHQYPIVDRNASVMDFKRRLSTQPPLSMIQATLRATKISTSVELVGSLSLYGLPSFISLSQLDFQSHQNKYFVRVGDVSPHRDTRIQLIERLAKVSGMPLLGKLDPTVFGDGLLSWLNSNHQHLITLFDPKGNMMNDYWLILFPVSSIDLIGAIVPRSSIRYFKYDPSDVVHVTVPSQLELPAAAATVVGSAASTPTTAGAPLLVTTASTLAPRTVEPTVSVPAHAPVVIPSSSASASSASFASSTATAIASTQVQAPGSPIRRKIPVINSQDTLSSPSFSSLATAAALQASAAAEMSSPPHMAPFMRLTSSSSSDRDHVRSSINLHALKSFGETHHWRFGAFAELIDNAVDASATNVYIDMDTVQNRTYVRDDGLGMDSNGVKHALAYIGNSTSRGKKNKIGRYGLGFKTGTMALGQSVLVWTKPNSVVSADWSIGYVTCMGPDPNAPIYPRVITFDTKGLSTSLPNDEDDFMKAIKDFEPDIDLDGLLSYFTRIPQYGTFICIYQPDDAVQHKLLVDEQNHDITIERYPPRSSGLTPDMDTKLRSYCALLFRQPIIKIHIQGLIVKPVQLDYELRNWVTYEQKENNYKVTFGKHPANFGGTGNVYSSKETGKLSGIFYYYNNRLIQSYHIPNPQGGSRRKTYERRYVGLVNTDELQGVSPINTKQSYGTSNWWFHQLDKWVSLVMETHATGTIKNVKSSDRNWVHCDVCTKWRSAPESITTKLTESKADWQCSAATWRSIKCSDPQEPYDDVAIIVRTAAATDGRTPTLVQVDDTENKEAAAALSIATHDLHIAPMMGSTSARRGADFIIERHLGFGGAADVYAAHDRQEDKMVALKVFRRVQGQSADDALTSVIKEFKAQKVVTHDSVLRTFGHTRLTHHQLQPTSYAMSSNGSSGDTAIASGDDHDSSGSLAMILEYIEDGKTLASVLDPRPTVSDGKVIVKSDESIIPNKQKKDWLLSIARGMACLHREHIAHRDLKPQNIMMAGYGQQLEAKICDFGLAKQVKQQISQTMSSRQGATTLYAPPSNSKRQTTATWDDLWIGDVYCFGLIMGQVLSGHAPEWYDDDNGEEFKCVSDVELLQAKQSGIAPRWRTIPNNVLSRDWYALRDDCLKFAPKDIKVAKSRPSFETIIQRLDALPVPDGDYPRYLYRLVYTTDSVMVNGLFARDVNETKTVRDHVTNGSSDGYKSQYISFSTDPVWVIYYWLRSLLAPDPARRQAVSTSAAIVRVDMEILQQTPGLKLHDLRDWSTTGIDASRRTQNFAQCALEILVEKHVPARAITKRWNLINSREGNSLLQHSHPLFAKQGKLSFKDWAAGIRRRANGFNWSNDADMKTLLDNSELTDINLPSEVQVINMLPSIEKPARKKKSSKKSATPKKKREKKEKREKKSNKRDHVTGTGRPKTKKGRTSAHGVAAAIAADNDNDNDNNSINIVTTTTSTLISAHNTSGYGNHDDDNDADGKAKATNSKRKRITLTDTDESDNDTKSGKDTDNDRESRSSKRVRTAGKKKKSEKKATKEPATATAAAIATTAGDDDAPAAVDEATDGTDSSTSATSGNGNANSGSIGNVDVDSDPDNNSDDTDDNGDGDDEEKAADGKPMFLKPYIFSSVGRDVKREVIHDMVKMYGGDYTYSVNHRTTHVIANRLDGTHRCGAVIRNGIPMANRAWLLRCIEHATLLPITHDDTPLPLA